jgi:cytochrome b561
MKASPALTCYGNQPEPRMLSFPYALSRPASRSISAIEGGRYNRALIAIHWLTALMMFAVVLIGLRMTEMPRRAPQREIWFTIHKSIGITILALVLLRLIVRSISRTPAYPAAMGMLERAMASVVHMLLYVVLLAMPLSGYITSLSGGHGFDWFFLFRIPDLVPRDQALSHLAAALHVAGQWAVYALVAVHIFGALYHVFVRRERIFARILP